MKSRHFLQELSHPWRIVSADSKERLDSAYTVLRQGAETRPAGVERITPGSTNASECK